MTDAQARLGGDNYRHEWRANSMQPIRDAQRGRWSAANTREPIRDETLHEGLVRTGAVRERTRMAFIRMVRDRTRQNFGIAQLS